MVSTLLTLHERLDALVAEAYGWPSAMDDQQILTSLAGLNATRRDEEEAGRVRYLRPELQAPGAARNRHGSR